MLANQAAIRLGMASPEHADREQAREAIDALAGVVELLAPLAPAEELEALRRDLAQLRMAFVQSRARRPAAPRGAGRAGRPRTTARPRSARDLDARRRAQPCTTARPAIEPTVRATVERARRAATPGRRLQRRRRRPGAQRTGRRTGHKGSASGVWNRPRLLRSPPRAAVRLRPAARRRAGFFSKGAESAMQTFLVEHNVLFALICGLLAVAYGAYLTRWVLQQSPGNERMREIQAAIQEGASAYLNRQYRTVGVVAVVVAALLLIAGIGRTTSAGRSRSASSSAPCSRPSRATSA